MYYSNEERNENWIGGETPSAFKFCAKIEYKMQNKTQFKMQITNGKREKKYTILNR